MRSPWDVLWGYENRYEFRPSPPTAGAWLWWKFACSFPDEVREFLEAKGQVVARTRPAGLQGYLEDMRWVYLHTAAADRTAAHRALRRFLEEDPRGFFAQLTRVEKAHLAEESKQRKRSYSRRGPPWV
jgi:hypothetical protein